MYKFTLLSKEVTIDKIFVYQFLIFWNLMLNKLN